MTEDRTYIILTALRNIKLSISDEMNEQLKPWFDDIEKAIEDEQMITKALSELSQKPTSEMVHVETLHQVMRERDIAIGQLKELGYDFGQKIEPCDDISPTAVLVTAEEAKRLLQAEWKKEVSKDKSNNRLLVAYKMAVQLLEQEPCDDAISLERAKRQIGRWIGYIDQDMINRICMSLDALPSVTQKSESVTEFADRCRECGARYGKMLKQKSGKWIDYSDEGYVECPFCNHATTCEDNIDELHYCFYCGARMVKPQESEVQE